MHTLPRWQEPFLGLDEIPRGLTGFEIGYFFRFSAAEGEAIASRRGDYHRLAAALHLAFIKMTGRTLDALDRIPVRVLFHLTDTLKLPTVELATLRALYTRQRTRFDHQRWAMDVLGFQPFSKGRQRVLVRSVRREAQKAIALPALIQLIKRWLYERTILIPPERRLKELAGRIYREAEQALFDSLDTDIPTPVREHWMYHLGAPWSEHKTALQWLQKVPKQRSQTSIDESLSRLMFLRILGVHHYPLSGICLERQRRYAQQMRRRRPARWRSLNEPGRTLEMVCFVHIVLLQTVDRVLSLLDLRITDLRRAALARVRDREQQTVRTVWNILATARRMAEDANVSDAEFRREFLALVPSDFMGHPSRAAALRSELTGDRRVRTVLSQLLTLCFEGPHDSPTLEALSQLSMLRSQRLSELPVDMAVRVPRSWSSLIQSEDRKQALRAFEAATLLSVHKALRNGSIWVSTSFSYRSRDQMFIGREQWQKRRREHYRRLRLPPKVDTYIKPQLAALQAGLAGVAQAVAQGEISIDEDGVHLTRLAAESEDRSVVLARKRLYRQIGNVQLPDLIVDIDRESRFSWALLGRSPNSEHELLVLYGALLAHGTAMNAAGVALMMPGVSEASIAEAMHFLERDDALREANRLVVEYLRSHPVINLWGKGQTASSDSMSLEVSRHLWNARIDPRRGTFSIGIYTHLLDQWGVIYDQPVVLGRRQAGAAIEGVVRQSAAEWIEWLAVDTHGYTDVAMGLAKLLGFDLCPRLKDLRDRTLHVPRSILVADSLASIVRQDVNLQHLQAQWDELVRIAASVESGETSAVLVLQRFGTAARGDPVHKAATALGQLQRTLFLCDYFTNVNFRRELSRLLYYGETLHTLQRAIHFGSIGAARGRRHEELVAISGSLTLLTNLVLAWNTHHTQRIYQQEDRGDGNDVPPEMLQHIPPVSFRHINFRGEFRFPIERAAQGLIPSYQRSVI